jgi:alcohol dehydrogenase class IV
MTLAGLSHKDIRCAFQLLPLETVHSGAGCIQGLGQTLAAHGISKALLITGGTLAKSPLLDQVQAAADGRIAAVFSHTVQHVHRPSVLAAAEAARAIGADGVISFGGGTSNDTAKAVLLCLAENIREAQDFDPLMIQFRYPDFIKVPSMTGEAVPLIAIPTTLSAGEFTHFVGITDPVRQVKDLAIDKQMMAKAVFLDPELTLATPHWLWLSSGMRSVDHCIEALCSTTAHPFTDGLGAHALRMLAHFLPVSKADPGDIAARSQLQIAAWMSVSGLANVTLGLSHGIGHQLGARCDVPHGHTSCVMMASTMRFNRDHTAPRQAWIADLMGVDTRNLAPETAADRAADAVEALVKDLDQPHRLRDVGVTAADFPAIAADALQDLIVATNPRPVTSEADVIKLLESAY